MNTSRIGLTLAIVISGPALVESASAQKTPSFDYGLPGLPGRQNRIEMPLLASPTNEDATRLQLRLPPGARWNSEALEAASVDPRILIAPDSTIDAQIIHIIPPDSTDEKMIVPPRMQVPRKP